MHTGHPLLLFFIGFISAPVLNNLLRCGCWWDLIAGVRRSFLLFVWPLLPRFRDSIDQGEEIRSSTPGKLTSPPTTSTALRLSTPMGLRSPLPPAYFHVHLKR